ncbi:GtrA family protein [Saccharothrix luteola]|uniref:GtrA family protein n=1 Tax=Saccharothrix luteola TaxID=2893018 RepID=UPI001E5A4CC4|nr:GtrA family protein [Saccharothrix luteola]MCC8242744.1 GtrA family protein [Saccharothrix luteola]
MKAVTGTSLRFCAVGVVNTLADLLGYTWLAVLGIPMFPANLISTSLCMAVSYPLNRSFTFRARSGALRTQLPLFILCTASGLWVVQPLVITATADLFATTTTLTAVMGPKLTALALGLVWSYVLCTRIVFRSWRPTE